MKNILTLQDDWQTLLTMFPSNWREFEFMLHQVQQSVNPDISLKKTINDWQEISKNLAENERKRQPQMNRFILG